MQLQNKKLICISSRLNVNLALIEDKAGRSRNVMVDIFFLLFAEVIRK